MVLWQSISLVLVLLLPWGPAVWRVSCGCQPAASALGDARRLKSQGGADLGNSLQRALLSQLRAWWSLQQGNRVKEEGREKKPDPGVKKKNTHEPPKQHHVLCPGTSLLASKCSWVGHGGRNWWLVPCEQVAKTVGKRLEILPVGAQSISKANVGFWSWTRPGLGVQSCLLQGIPTTAGRKWAAARLKVGRTRVALGEEGCGELPPRGAAKKNRSKHCWA